MTKLVYLEQLDNYTFNQTFTFIKGSGNTVTVKETSGNEEYFTTLTLNSNGLLSKVEKSSEGYTYSKTYTYDNIGNITKWSWNEKSGSETWENSCEITYDNKNAPFRNCATPKWFLTYWADDMIFHNNPTEIIEDDGDKTVFTYVYDSDNYPSKRTTKYNDDEYVETFTYISK